MKHFEIYWKVGDFARRWTHTMLSARMHDEQATLRKALLDDLVAADVLEYAFKEVTPGNAEPEG